MVYVGCDLPDNLTFSDTLFLVCIHRAVMHPLMCSNVINARLSLFCVELALDKCSGNAKV